MKQQYKHLFFWCTHALLLYLFYEYLLTTKAAIIHTASFIFHQLIAFYINLYFLLPKLYQKHRYTFFIFYNSILVIGSSLLHTYIETFFSHNNEGSNHSIKLEPLLAHALPSLLAVFGAFILYAYSKRKQQEQKELEILKAEKKFLIQQINPHFLFNTLNNIYSLTLENNPKASEALLHLSKMLDYSLYGNKNEFVPLTNEVLYIKNFIALFKLKDDEIQNIIFNCENTSPSSTIAPLLLLPFVENAFKHGNIEDLKNGRINIRISSNNNEIEFHCSNTYCKNKSVDGVGGIGITNVSRRLELLYPKQHTLTIFDENQIYNVVLKIYPNEV